MTVIPKVQGDIEDTILMVLSGVEDLATVTSIEAHVFRAGYETVVLDAEIVDPVARTVLIQLGGASGWLATAEPGLWKLEEELRFVPPMKLTWPADDQALDFIKVRLDG